MNKICLAYSGGLDTSIIITWLKENYGCDVVAVAVDVGQAEETSGLADKAYRTGASEFYLVDAKEEFAKDYLFPVLKAGAIYERDYLLGTSTARPLIARKQVEIALATGCDALAHGCTGKGNDQVRFELAYQALAPELKVVAPWREWSIISREDAIDYAASRGIPVPVTKKDPYSRDRNLWHLSHEGGPLEDPSFEPEASMFKLTVDPSLAPQTPEKVTIAFESGVPVDLNPTLMAASERAFAIIRAAAERLAALAPPGVPRPPAMMMALHIWSMSHGVASLFGRGDAARRKLPMSPEELLEAEVLIYLRGLGFPTDRPSGANDKPDEAPAGASGPPSGPWGKPK